MKAATALLGASFAERADAEAWARAWGDRARAAEGFRSMEILRPVAADGEWVLSLRFERGESLDAFLAEHPPEGARLQVLVEAGAAEPVTVVASHRVEAVDEEAFRAWQARLTRAAARFEGFQGAELLPPSGGQTAWVAVFRFEDPAALDRWMESAERERLLAEGRRFLEDLELQALRGAFGSWFDPREGAEAPAWKQAMTVELTLFPTVVILAYLLDPLLAPLPFPARVLSSTIVSVAFLTWVAMPLATRILGRWLVDDQVGTSLLGAAALTGVTLTFLAVFLLLPPPS